MSRRARRAPRRRSPRPQRRRARAGAGGGRRRPPAPWDPRAPAPAARWCCPWGAPVHGQGSPGLANRAPSPKAIARGLVRAPSGRDRASQCTARARLWRARAGQGAPTARPGIQGRAECEAGSDRKKCRRRNTAFFIWCARRCARAEGDRARIRFQSSQYSVPMWIHVLKTSVIHQCYIPFYFNVIQ